MEVLVIGGGAAGMFCAITAAEAGARVTLLEKNEKPGKKLFITGKGRCNFTNACTPSEFRDNVLTNPRFLFSASEALTPQDVISDFEKWGLKTKVERGRRAFPMSDRSADVIDTLKAQLAKNHVRVILNTTVEKVLIQDGRAVGVLARHTDTAAADRHSADPVRPRAETWHADAVVVATGGLSYESTGSTGDGYRFARDAGLSVTKCSPSLVPVNCREEYIRELQGLSLKNVSLTVKSGKKVLFNGFGEMMFTHFGITGPLVLSMSAKIGPGIGTMDMQTEIDLKPAVTEEMLDARLLRIFRENPKKALKNVLHELYPSKMLDVIPDLAGIDPSARCCDLTKKDREALVRVTKQFPLTLTSLRGYHEAVITKGGVNVRGINPKTMEAKSVKGLYFIGEVLDLDAYTGGYNLQIAWCTAYACGRAVAAT